MYICHASYLRNSIAYNYDFCYTSVNDDIFWCFFHFLIFSYFGLLGEGKKGKKLPKINNNNYIRHMPYLKNRAYNRDFWCKQ